MLFDEQIEAETAITTKDLRKALAMARGNSKELIEAEIDYGYYEKSFRPEGRD